MTSVHEDLADVFRAVTIISNTSFRIRNESVQDTSSFPVPLVAPGVPVHPVSENALVRGLQANLYHRCYCHRLDEEVSPLPNRLEPSEAFIERLAGANPNRDGWEEGFQVYLILPDGTVYASKGDRQARARPGEFLMKRLSVAPPAVGNGVRLRRWRGSTTLQTGFYFAFGAQSPDIWDAHFTARLYFNASPEGTLALVHHLGGMLNRFQVPYHLKALTDPNGYSRSDSMVLYLARKHVRLLARIVLQLPDECAGSLATTEPLFTHRVRPGVGSAEDPGNGESFGMHRCRLVAEGIVDAWHQGRQEVSARARAVANRFRAAGLDLDRPHLRGDLSDLPLPPLGAEAS